jgi:hypothetical protein
VWRDAASLVFAQRQEDHLHTWPLWTRPFTHPEPHLAPRSPTRQLGAGPDVVLEARAAAARAPLLRHVSYMQQPPLDTLTQGEVAAVLEVVLGRAGGAVAPSAITGCCDEEAPAAHWASPSLLPEGAPKVAAGAPPAQPHLSSAGEGGAGGGGGRPGITLPRESLGQVAGCILAKMVVNTWLGAGPAAAAPLVLRMLQQALHNTHACVRARAFDLVYNLSIHGTMLSTSDDPKEGEGASQAAARSAAPLQVAVGRLPPRSAPPELAAQSYARPQSPAGAPRTRTVAGHPVSQLPSPRIHLPPQVMATPGGGSGGSGGSSGSSGGGSSPRSPLAGHNPATGGTTPPSPTPWPASPRSRLGRGANNGGAPFDGPAASTAAGGSSGISSGGSGGSGVAVPGLPGAAASGVSEGNSSSNMSLGASGSQVQLEFEAWLRRLLFELLCMLAQVRYNAQCAQAHTARCCSKLRLSRWRTS